jgi:hypothetical protein
MTYFKNLPDIIYPSLKRESYSHDFVKIKNLFKRAYIPENILRNYASFENYEIQGDDRPDVVSKKYYDNAKYDWVIFIANNIQNVRDEWPMSQSDLNRYLLEKYTEQELSQVHHYETTEVRNSLNHVILKSGIKIPSNYVFKYTESQGLTTEVISLNPVQEITNYEYELKLNDEKRSIILIRPEYINIIERELLTLFRYPVSRSFVDEFTIKVEDPCIPPI